MAPWDSGLPPAYPISVPDRVAPTYEGEKLGRLLPRGTIAERRSIHDRPEAVQARREGALPTCRRPRPVLALKERKTHLVLAARLVGKSAAGTVAVISGVPPARPAPALVHHARQRHRVRPA